MRNSLLLVARTGIEPAISAVKGRRPGPLDDRAKQVESVAYITHESQPSATPLGPSPLSHKENGMFSI